MIPYNPKNHYWEVGEDTSRVYSSYIGDYVDVGNQAYQKWVASGGVATKIDSEASLGDVFAYLQLRPINAAVLDGYTTSQTNQLTLQVIAKVLLWCVNHIRALEGQSTFTAQQFKAFLKGLM